VTVNDHSEEHPLNWTIPLILGGGSVRHTRLEEAHLLDVPSTVAWALGVTPPAVYTGRVLIEGIRTGEDEIMREAAAVA